MSCILRLLGGKQRLGGFGISRDEIFRGWKGRDLGVRVGVRVRNSMQDVTHGKGLLADVVRMLVAWERSLEEK